MSHWGRATRACLLAGTMLAFTSTTAFASGIELAWNHCFGQFGTQSVRTSTCATNSGSQTMIASFRPPSGVTALEGVEVFIDVQVLGGVLPCWWNFAVGQVRNDQLAPLPVSPTDVNGDPLIHCDNHYFLERGASGGGAMAVMGADWGRLRGIASIPAGTGMPVTAEAQYYGVGFRISNDLSTPAGGCTGCLQAACFHLRLIQLYSIGQPDVVLQYPHPGSENWITWQGDAQSTGCPAPHTPPLPVLPRTWGSIKSIYR